MRKISSPYHLSPEVVRARTAKIPIVALETTVLTHGLPEPVNLELAQDMAETIRSHGAVPATIGILNGQIHVGMDQDQLRELAKARNLRKISRRDFGFVIAMKGSGGTTVAGTMIVAKSVGIKVFATGGIGGVHRGAPFDVSADLQELSRTPVIVVCAGAKAILDLPATVEMLETLGVPVIGYKTEEFPAFYAKSSGLPVNYQAESAKEIADIAKEHWQLGLNSAVLVVVPPPMESALNESEMEAAIEQALSEARNNNIRGQKVTPFLLKRVSEFTEQESLHANLALLINNAIVAAQIAKAYHCDVSLSES